MFDFPASPAVGDVSNGYMWNGTGWSGGPVVGTPKEQFFDVAGKAQQDIAVPSWAKNAVIYMTLWPAANQQTNILVSADGSTFPNSGTDYSIQGFSQQSGNNTYPNQPPLAINRIPIAPACAVPSGIPMMAEVHFAVARGGAFNGRILSSAYDNTATVYQYHRFHSFYVNAALAGAMQLKVLRFYVDTGTWGAGSNIRVEWLGADIPQSNAITEAPADGWEYTRVNGIWRQKERTFVLDGLLQQEVVVPAFAKGVQINGSIFTGNSLGLPGLHISMDGATYLSGATPYTVSGQYHDSGTSPYYGTQGAVVSASMQFAFGGDNLNVPNVFIAEMGLVTATTLISVRSHGMSYRNTAPIQTRTAILHNYANVPAGTQRVQKFRFMNGSNVTPTLAFGANSYFTVKWLG